MNNVKFNVSQTMQNLINFFADKSQTCVKYNLYSEIAQKEGFEQISNIFLQTAKHEYMHAKLFFNHLENAYVGNIDYSYSYLSGTTEENLSYALSAADNRNEQYLKAEETALKEGFDSIAATFKHVRNAQEHHIKRFRILFENIRNNTVFDKEEQQQWFCTRCGYVYNDNAAPNYCPNCYALKSYFEIMCEKY